MDVIRISLKGAYDTTAQDRKILRELRKRGLLSTNYVFRGFKLENLNQLLESGIDHDPRQITFCSTTSQLISDDRDVNALEYALFGGCLAVYKASSMVHDKAGGYHVPPNVRDHLVAVLVIED